MGLFTQIHASINLRDTEIGRCLSLFVATCHHDNAIFSRGNARVSRREEWRAIKVTVGGKCGMGKSTLANRLVERDIFRADDVRVCTTQAQSVFLDASPGVVRPSFGVLLTDLPGLADGTIASAKYKALYSSWTRSSAVFLYIVRADDRALESDEKAIAALASTDNLVVGISQVDRIGDYREWCSKSHRPGPVQVKLIDEKVDQVASSFGISAARVIPFSAGQGYGLEPLMLAVETRLRQIPDR